ncbi:MAG TPA: PQQ-binding-like beta-propeller repeat protein [Solirubrobacteraceae bacterium]|nr:PQQ-binding-like beta-propeller repeat protein [Solirubrobacteraceae bacterium]
MRFLRLPSSNRKMWLFAAASVLLAVVVAGVAIYELGKPKNTLNPNAPFVATTPTTKTRTKHVAFTWPIYGYTATRIRDFTGDPNLNPPFRKAWSFGGNALLEFPASIHGAALYFLDDGATAKKVNVNSHKLVWLTHVGKQSAATPTLDPRTHQLFVPVLSTTSAVINARGGEFAALSMKSGKILWKYPVPSGTESSPIVVGNSVYFGDQGGTEYSLNIKTGHENWSVATDGAIKAGADYFDGNIYFGTYGGSFYALNAKTGKQVWKQSPGGEFYSTPAIAYGRVYVGNNNGAAYSYVASNGTPAWTRVIGNYAYSGPAVADIPGLGRTVFIGSYEGHSGSLYALNAKTGATEWSYPAGDAISGSATVINNTVYFSTVYSKGSYGLNAKTGKKVWFYPDGSYTPVVATPDAIFLMGKYVIYKFVPKK